MLILQEYLAPGWKGVIPKVTVFDIETLEEECSHGFEHKLVSIAMTSEIDNQTKYWVIESSCESARQKIGNKLEHFF